MRGDSCTPGDDDGDNLCWRETWELMNTNVGVRVLVPAGTPSSEAVRLLRKIVSLIERSRAIDTARSGTAHTEGDDHGK
jgi:hypothetical protein